MKFYAKTDLGKVRQINQDYYIAINNKIGIFPNLFIVADGVGSNSESGYASSYCANFLKDKISLVTTGNDYKDEILKAYKLVNSDLFYKILANPSYEGMGTTMVLTTIFNNHAIFANVGDSRGYHIRDSINQITFDHNMAEELARENEIKRFSEDYYKYRSQLTRAIGATKDIEVDFFEVDIMEGDYILLCSDGLTNMVSNERIYDIINKKKSIEDKVRELIDVANANGGKDNIAVLLIYIDKINKEDSIFEIEKHQLNEQLRKILDEERNKKKPFGIRIEEDVDVKKYSFKKDFKLGVNHE